MLKVFFILVLLLQINHKFIKYFLNIFTVFLLVNSSYAQTITYSGFVEDASTGERLVGATIYVPQQGIGVISNTYGYFSLSVDETETVSCSFLGYESQTLHKNTNQSLLTIKLQAQSSNIEEVAVIENRSEINQGVLSLSPKQMQKLPVILGETDVLKAYQLMPGVSGGMEGTAGLIIRGSDPSQNLYLLDDVPVYNVNHLFGLFSVFNADALKSSKLYKGTFPAKYGGRVAAVLELTMKEGNTQKLSGNFSIGLVSAKAFLEGPLNDKTSFMLSGRTSYINLFAYPYFKFFLDDNSTWLYNFHDINAKINHRFNNKHRIYLSYYTGQDRYSSTLNEQNGTEKFYQKDYLNWGNHTATLRLNSVFGEKLFQNATIVFGNYKFLSGTQMENRVESTEELTSSFEKEYSSGITDIGLKWDMTYFTSKNLKLNFGINAFNHKFTPGVNVNAISSLTQTAELDSVSQNEQYVNQELAFYIDTEFKIVKKLKANLGIRNVYYLANNCSYPSIEPRLSLSYKPLEHSQIQLAYGITTQNMHLLSSSSLGMPTDQWVPITDEIKPIYADQISVAYFYTPNRRYSLSLEGYIKNMNNVLAYEENADLSLNWEEIVQQGDGYAKGIELLLSKNQGSLTGWIAYALSKSERQFDEINNGEPYYFKYDRTHDFKITLNYKFNERIDVSANWVFNTGNAVTLPLGLYQGLYNTIYTATRYNTSEILYYENKNDFRMPNYHRLDLALSLHKAKEKYSTTLSFGLYNAYNQHNAFYYDFFKGQLRGIGVVPIIPSVDYKISF